MIEDYSPFRLRTLPTLPKLRSDLTRTADEFEGYRVGSGGERIGKQGCRGSGEMKTGQRKDFEACEALHLRSDAREISVAVMRLHYVS